MAWGRRRFRDRSRPNRSPERRSAREGKKKKKISPPPLLEPIDPPLERRGGPTSTAVVCHPPNRCWPSPRQSRHRPPLETKKEKGRKKKMKKGKKKTILPILWFFFEIQRGTGRGGGRNGRLRSFSSRRFQALLTLSSEFFASFPRGTCMLSVFRRYLALDGVSHPFRAAISGNPTLRRQTTQLERHPPKKKTPGHERDFHPP